MKHSTREICAASGTYPYPRALPFSGDALWFPSLSLPLLSPISSAQFRGINLERRPVKKMLGNIQVDSLTRNRRWRSQCVFRIHVERPVKEGIEVVRVFLSPQAEHVELTSREHSPPPTLIWSPPNQTYAYAAHTRRQQQRTDDVAAQDALLTGMIYTLSCRLLSGTQYTSVEIDGGRWKLYSASGLRARRCSV